MEREGISRAIVVCGSTIARKTDLITRVKSAIGNRLAGVFDKVSRGSPLPDVLAGVKFAKSRDADALIAVGGGSAIVTTRAITILAAEKGSPRELATQYPKNGRPISPRLEEPKLPNFVVLTTPTAAANRSGTAVIDPEINHRLEYFDPKTRPRAVIWDTAALLTAEPDLCKDASASVISSVIAGLQTDNLNALAQGDLLQSFNLLRASLPALDRQPDSGQVRLELCAATFMYNRAIDSGATGNPLGVVNALAHSIATRFEDCNHGDAYAVLTAPSMRFNRSSNQAGQVKLATLIGINAEAANETDAVSIATERVAGIFREMGMPARLRDLDLPREALGQIAEDAMTDFAMHHNVRQVDDAGELTALLEDAW